MYQPMNSSEGKTCLSDHAGDERPVNIDGELESSSVHWSLLEMRNPWSTLALSPSVASSNVFTISTSRPFCVPKRAPSTEAPAL